MEYEKENPVPEETQENMDLHQSMMKEFDNIHSVYYQERKMNREDRRFVGISGAHWEDCGLEKQFENHPMYEFDLISPAIKRIENEHRNNKVSVQFIAKDGASPKNAEAVQSLFRADEQDSFAKEAYDNGFSESLKGGIGAIRLRDEYENEEDDEDERIRIRFDPVYDADMTVWWDLNAKRFDKADANHCWLIKSMTHQAFEDAYPDEDPVSVQTDLCRATFDWYQPDLVHVAENYRIETEEETVRVFEDISGKEVEYSEEDFENDTELEEYLVATGHIETRKKTLKIQRVHKYIVSGVKILEDCGYVSGKYIPVIPFYGHREFIDNIERCRGHVRHPKDAQRVINMQLSKLAEIAALSTIEKPVFYPDEISNHAEEWSRDNIDNKPYLQKEPMYDVNGNLIQVAREYTKPPQIPPALGGMIEFTNRTMGDMLGNQERGEKIVSNISGKAVQLIQRRLDYQAYIYEDNFAKSMHRVGKVWLSKAKEVYYEKDRMMKGVDESGKTKKVQLNRNSTNESGMRVVENSFAEIDDVVVSVGPSSESARAAAAEASVNLLATGVEGELREVIQFTAVMNMEGEGIPREYARKKLVSMGALEPLEEDKQWMDQEAQKPDPNAEFLQAEAQKSNAQAKKAEADTALAMAKVKETEAKTRETKADTLKTLDEIGKEPQNV